MPLGIRRHLREGLAFLRDWITPNLRVFRSTRQPAMWLLAVAIGVGVAIAAIVFRLSIEIIQWPWLGVISERVASSAAALPWWVLLLTPAAGGLMVGLLLQYAMPGRRVEVVADVIEARNFASRRLTLRGGVVSAAISALSLGAGASAGREGPVVHLGASLATQLQRIVDLPQAARPVILACGVAAAVSASFNVPIAGVLFAHEVILGHYALSAFVPIVLSSVVATVLSRLWFGEFPAFIIPDYQITSYLEVPAFMLLGLVCAVVAILFQFALMGSDYVARNIRMPLILRPVVGGLMVGAIAIAYPQILGVGYETTDLALHQKLPLLLMLTLIVVKTAATSITLAARFGGGIFSPSLYLGAMTGGAFGIIAASVFPDMASSAGLYAILGMGAVAASVLGAPISTTMIVFELTGGYSVTLALLVAVSVASGLTQAVHGRSYFHWQLQSRGLFLQEGAHKRIVRQVRVSDFMRLLGDDEDPGPLDPQDETPFLTPSDTLESALQHFDASGVSRIPVIAEDDATKVVGYAYQVDALSSFTRALIAANVEEHR
ncbi:MAG: chloride channel protein [Flavobacteriaceae bacterium]